MSKDATYANMQASLTLYARQTILPRVMILEQKLNEMLAPRYGDRLFLAAENPVPADEAFELQKTQIAINAGVLSADEIRAATGYSARPDDAGYGNPNRAAEAISEGPVHPSSPPPAGANSPECKPALAPPAGTPVHPQAGQEAKLLLAINKAVGRGDMERAVAISVVSRQLGIPQTQARSLVGHPKENKPTAPETLSLPTTRPTASIVAATGPPADRHG